MVFEGAAEGPDGGFFVAAGRAFPGEHRAFIAVIGGVLHGGREAPVAVFHQGGGDLWLEQEQGGVHPDLGVPKGVTVVAEAAQAHGGEAVGRAFAGKGVQVIEHEPDIALQGVVAVDEDIALPQLIPGLFVRFYQLFASLEGGEEGEAFGFVEGIVVVGRGEGGADDGEVVGGACLQLFPEFYQMHIVVPHLMDDGGFRAMGLVEEDAVGGGHEQFPGGAFGRGGQQGYGDMGPVDLVVIVFDVFQHIGRLHDAGRDDLDVFMGGDGDVYQGRIG